MIKKKHKAIRIDSEDNVAVALENLVQGEEIQVGEDKLTIHSAVQAKHKFALEDLHPKDPIFMYGVLVGKAVEFIGKGMVLTTENVKHESSKAILTDTFNPWNKPNITRWENRNFMGYPRSDGQVGTDNIWLFFPLVFCENRNIEKLKDIFMSELYFQKSDKHKMLLRSLLHNGDTETRDTEGSTKVRVFEHVDVRFLMHDGGCGGIRQDSEMLARLFAGYVNNPNVVGATVLSLGCQNLQIDVFRNALKAMNPNFEKPLLIYEQQQEGTVDDLLSKIIQESFIEIKKANALRRQAMPISKLSIGLECGGSDGFSGISANPTLGKVSDILAALDGKTILSEFPELCGVEQELVNRCEDKQIASKFLSLMADFESSAIEAGSGFDMNPSPGNIKDGLITDAMKSAGAAKKGGTSTVRDVIDYGEYAHKAGLNLLCTPGNDVESTTAMAGAGANIMLFTTGLGTPTGNPIAPVIKVSSNTKLAERMPDIIDFNTGPIIAGEKSVDEMADDLLEYIIDVASGNQLTKAQQLEQYDFIPWKRGVSL